jgi:hypothetical protein
MGVKNKIISGLIDHKNDPFIDLSKTRGESEWHHEFILHIASILRPKVYVELGLRKCPLFNRMIPFADKLIGVDIDQQAGLFMVSSQKAEFVCSPTLTFAASFKDRNMMIDLLFIDADHSEKAVWDDFNAYFPFVKEDGIIILHDSYPKNEEWTASHLCGDGYKAIHKLSERTSDYEMMTLPFHPGLTLCRKRKKQLPWIN